MKRRTAIMAAVVLTLLGAVGLAARPARAHGGGPGPDHAARRLHHRLARLLAGPALGPAADAPDSPTSTSSARCRGGGCIPARLRRRQRGPRRLLATGIADQNQLPGWLAATRPDIVLMHFGTNDVWSNIPHRDHPGRVQQAGRPDAGQQPGHEDPRRPDHPDDPERLHRLPGRRGRAQQRDPGLGRRARPPRSRRSPSSTS